MTTDEYPKGWEYQTIFPQTPQAHTPVMSWRWPTDERSQRYLALQLVAGTRDLWMTGSKAWMAIADDVIAYVESGEVPT
jgi:hypothetical protein